MDITYLLFLQNIRTALGGVLDSFMLLISSLGEGTFTFLLLAAVYWCVDKGIGQYMGFNVAFACTLNQYLKAELRIERPWVRDERIHPVEAALPGAGGYSLPSGHTARAIAVWGGAGSAAWKRRAQRIPGAFCWLVTALIMFSRNYLGVHTPQDVALSFLLGVALLYLTGKMLELASQRPELDIVICLAGCLLCFLPMLRIGCMSNAGAGMGILIGWLLERRYIRFEVEGSLSERLTRFGIGGLLFLLLYKAATPALSLFMESKYAGFFMSFAAAFYIMVVWPFLFTCLKRLREREAGGSEEAFACQEAGEGEEALSCRKQEKSGAAFKFAIFLAAGLLLLLLCLSALIAAQVRRNTQEEAAREQEVSGQSESEQEENAAQTAQTPAQQGDGAQDSAVQGQDASSQGSWAQEEQELSIIAHRGYSGVYPENTLSAFAGAIDIGADYIELDVQLTADGEVVVFHDGDIDRITGMEGTIADYTAAELAEMDAGSWFASGFAGERIPALEEVLTLVKESGCQVYLELKDIGEADGFAEKVVETAEGCGMAERCIFASFNGEYLTQIREMDGDYRVLYNTLSGSSSLPQEFSADYYGLYVESVTADTVRAIHESGGKAFVWTANTPSQMLNVQAMGADGIVTNYPGLARVVTQPEYSYLAEHFEKTITLPGLYEAERSGDLDDYVVQGLTKAGNLLVLSAYSCSGEKTSILYIIGEDGRLQRTIDLGFKAHTGGIAYDEPHDLLWVTGAEGRVYAVRWSEILDSSWQGGIAVEFDAGLTNHNGTKVASFLTLYGGELFVGSYVNGADGVLNRYDISNVENPVLTAVMAIPERIQGITFREDVAAGSREMLLSQGYQTEDSRLLRFSYDERENDYTEPEASAVLPEGAEQIQMTADGLYVLFESAVRPYRATARIPNDQIYVLRQ